MKNYLLHKYEQIIFTSNLSLIFLVLFIKPTLYFLKYLKEIRNQYDQDLQQDQSI
jgi:hypothetical protein